MAGHLVSSSSSNSNSNSNSGGQFDQPIAGPSHSNGTAVTRFNGAPLSPLGETNGFSTTNGHGQTSSSSASAAASAIIRRVSPPGTTLYKDSTIDREEFVRLVLQSLRDVGYNQAANTLEAESGYSVESDIVADFRDCVLNGRWELVESALPDMGVTSAHDIRTASFLIRQQKYLEHLESRRTDLALLVLRNEIAPLSFDSDKLHLLSSLMMCTSTDELLRRAHWDGANGLSRRRVLLELQRLIPASVMIPSRRLESLLNQAQTSQRKACLYHNSKDPFSLYSDHDCGKSTFPGVTTNILAEHEDEVWNIEWSHDGRFLASGGSDKLAIVWRIGPPTDQPGRECAMERVFRDHDSAIGALAWTWDDSVLITSSDHIIKLWNVKTGLCIKEIKDHTEVVSAVRLLPDRTGFVSSAMDCNILFWDNSGNPIEERSLRRTSVRITDFALSPDGRKLVAVGQPKESRLPIGTVPTLTVPFGKPYPASMSGEDQHNGKRTQLITFDLVNKTRQVSHPRVGDMTSVQISEDSRYALINYSPGTSFLWDIQTSQVTRRFVGHLHDNNVIRSCFGGANSTFILSGSEDAKIYVWHRDTAELLETLEGHGAGSVNGVAWNPADDTLFASCSDDYTIRIWEAPHWGTTPNSSTSRGLQWRSHSSQHTHLNGASTISLA